jgi:hypothetical protein
VPQRQHLPTFTNDRAARSPKGHNWPKKMAPILGDVWGDRGDRGRALGVRAAFILPHSWIFDTLKVRQYEAAPKGSLILFLSVYSFKSTNTHYSISSWRQQVFRYGAKAIGCVPSTGSIQNRHIRSQRAHCRRNGGLCCTSGASDNSYLIIRRLGPPRDAVGRREGTALA